MITETRFKKARFLAIEAGGIKALSAVPVLTRMLESGKRFEGAAGSSAGALLAFLLGMVQDRNDAISRLEKTVASIPFKSLLPTSWPVRIINLLRFGAMSDGRALETWIKNTLLEMLGEAGGLESRYNRNLSEMTFRQYRFKFNFDLRVAIARRDRPGILICSPANVPHLPVWAALRASTAINLAFSPLRINGEPYSDGGGLVMYPFAAFGLQPDGSINEGPVDRTVGIKFVDDSDRPVEMIDGLPGPDFEIETRRESISETLKRSKAELQAGFQNAHVREKDWKGTIRIVVRGLSMLDLDPSAEQLAYLRQRGEIAAASLPI